MRFRALRTERGETLREVAASAGMDPALLSKIEHGSRPPTAEQVTGLAHHFSISEDDLQAQRIAVDFVAKYGNQPSVRLAISLIAEMLASDNRDGMVGRGSDK